MNHPHPMTYRAHLKVQICKNKRLPTLCFTMDDDDNAANISPKMQKDYLQHYRLATRLTKPCQPTANA